MLQLSFNQKVGVGFATIILLLLTSSLSTLWNLNDINGSSTRVNETAVPVVKESNNVQIQLLKLAKLSSLAFNAIDQKEIFTYKKDFEIGTARFDELYSSLEILASKDSDMQALVIDDNESALTILTEMLLNLGFITAYHAVIKQANQQLRIFFLVQAFFI